MLLLFISPVKKFGSEKIGLLQSDKTENENEEKSAIQPPSHSNYLWGALIGYLLFIGILTVLVIIFLSL